MANTSTYIDLAENVDLAKDPDQFTAAEVALLAERLESNQYDTVFGSLDDWRKLRAVAFYSPQLVTPYQHLLELEVDED